MNTEPTFRSLFFGLLAAFLAVRLFYTYRGRRQGSFQRLSPAAIQREGGPSVVLRLTSFLGGLGAIALYALAPERIALFAVPFTDWARWLGAALGILDLPLLIWVHHTLGRQWSTSLELQEQHQLVITGPYRWVRHPMYAALFAAFIALIFVSANLLIALPLIGAMVLIYKRIDAEEAMLTERFGDEYRAYAARTGRFLPRRDPTANDSLKD